MPNKCVVSPFAKLALLIAIFLFSNLSSAQSSWDVVAGWNLLGNGSIGRLDVANTVFGDAAKVKTVWKWNNVTGKWAIFAPSLTNSDLATYAQKNGYEVLTSIEPKEGFWVNASTGFAATTPWNGGAQIALSDLHKGWNLMGSNVNKTPSELLQDLRADLYTPDKVISTVWAWDTAAVGWKFFAPSLEESQQLSTYISAHGLQPFTAAIVPGSGYWINVVDPSPSDFFVVPTDITRVSYPDSYQTVSTKLSDINSDPCKLDLDVLTYPRSWLGKYPLPKIEGAPLNSSVFRGMNLKDIGLGPPDNPAFILNGAPGAPNGCMGSLHTEFTKTIGRLKALNVDYVYIPQWHWISKTSDGSWYIKKAEDVFGALSDSDLKFFVETAHAKGIKVVMKNQISGMVDDPNSGAYGPAANAENYSKYFAAFQSFMNERSVFFQSIGIDVWEVGCNVCLYQDWGDGSQATNEVFRAAISNVINDIKKTFTGKTLMHSAAPWLMSDTEFLSNIDIVQISIYASKLTEDQMKTLSVDSYKAINAGYFSDVQSRVAQLNSLGKQVMLEIGGVQSRLDTFTFPGYIEETGCIAAVGDWNASNKECIQKNVTIDYSTQAIFYEALFEFANTIPSQSNLMVFVLDYWETDSMTPQTAFPNMASSIRNKPAEGILKSWYAR